MKKRGRAPRDEVVIEGSDNVLADLGIEMSEADMLKLHLSIAITNAIRKRKLTQTRAAKLAGIDQPKISCILRGRLDGFSEGRLMEILFRLGRDMEVRFPERIHQSRGELRIRA